MMQRTFPLRILVQTDMVGAIIGRSGSTIKSITQQTKARIDVHRKEGPDQLEKVITINGQPDSCSDACYKIIEIIQNERSAKYDGHNPGDRDITLKILAPNNLIARLIGRGGSIIKKMMEQTSTKISISMNAITESTGEHTITVTGRLEQVLQAEKLISSKLRAAYSSDLNNSLQTMNQQPYLFNNVPLPYMPNPYAQGSILSSLVGSQSGHHHHHHHHQQQHQHHQQHHNNNNNNNNNSTASRNLPMASHQAHLSTPGVYPATTGYLPLYPNINLPQAGPGILGFNSVGFEGTEKETVHIYIPSTMVGAIIGKSGSAIKEMIHTSGANIKVATAPPVPAEPTPPPPPPPPTAQDHTDEQHDEPNESKDDNKLEKRESLESKPKDEPQNQAEECSETPSEHKPAVAADATRTARKQHSATQNDCQTTSSSSRRVTIVGYPASQYSAQCLIYRKVSIEAGEGDISLMVEIKVPSQFVGRIIGKGGATVKQLQKTTRTMIRLPDDKSSQPQPNANNELDTTIVPETVVQITGKFEGSQTAQRHIRSLIRDSPHSRHNNNNNNSNSNNNNNNNSMSQSKGNEESNEGSNDNAQIDSSINNNHLNDNRNNDISTSSDLNDKSTSLSSSSSSEATTTATTTYEKQGTYNKNSSSSECNPPRIESTKTELVEEKSQQSPISETLPISNGDNEKADDQRQQQQENIVSNNNTINDNLNSSNTTLNDVATIKIKERHVDDKSSKGNECVENGESYVHVHN